jgi:hypothetical protein
MNYMQPEIIFWSAWKYVGLGDNKFESNQDAK